MLVTPQNSPPDRRNSGLADVRALIENNEAAASTLELNDDAQHDLDKAHNLLVDYLATASATINGFNDKTAVVDSSIDAFRLEFERVGEEMQAITDHLTADVYQAQLENARDRRSANLGIVWSLGSTFVVLLGATWLVARSIRRTLWHIQTVADQIASGNLTARTASLPPDVIGELGATVDLMAASLQTMVTDLETNRARSAFGSELTSALEMVDSELDVHLTIGRAMSAIDGDARMELLLADSSEAKLTSAVQHPQNGAPGCDVESPFGCVAVRRGAPVVFDHSENLDACPRLINRPEGECSAVCVPVGFMGRSLGVLHVTGPAHQPPCPDTVDRLNTLATASGTRIGTVRAFDASQRQAATDPLTGLLNRRSFEAEVSGLIRRGMPIALAMADLDHFKWLNDTHGHESGDRALKMFARILASAVRDIDLVARWGGEEFVVAFSGGNAAVASEALERVRASLMVEAAHGDLPAFTSSFGVADSTMTPLLEDMVRIADRALYAAKDAGRDCVRIGRTSDANRTDRPQHDTTAQIDPTLVNQR
ncbi:MAG: diguanylate cyclase [Acidimicrobiales bacterium]